MFRPPPPTKTIILGTVYFKRLSRKSKGFYQFPGFYTRFTPMSWRVNGRRRSEEVGTLHSALPFIALSAADWAAALARNDSRGFSPSPGQRPPQMMNLTVDGRRSANTTRGESFQAPAAGQITPGWSVLLICRPHQPYDARTKSVAGICKAREWSRVCPATFYKTFTRILPLPLR